MINAKTAFEHLGLSTSSLAGSIQAARALVGTNKCAGAQKLIADLLEVEIEFTEPNMALVTALSVVEAIYKAKFEYECPVQVLSDAANRAFSHISDPNHIWMYANAEASVESGEMKEIGAAGVVVPMSADGGVKRGGKQIIANALYKKMIIDSETPATSKQFLETLMKEANMTLAGARTYYTNAKNHFKTAAVA